MGLFNFSMLKNTIKDVKNRMSELDTEISELKIQCAELVSMPLPYDDFIEWAVCRYDRLASGFESQFKREIMSAGSTMQTYYMSQRTGHETLEDFLAVFGDNCPITFERPIYLGHSLPMTEQAFFYIFKDTIKAGIRRVMDETVKPQWPNKVGLSRADRIPQIEKLEKRLSALITEREQIQTELSVAVSLGG